jgi:hypothetical protein
VTNTTPSGSVPSAASGEPSLTPGEIAGAADSTELVFINSVEGFSEAARAYIQAEHAVLVDYIQTMRLITQARSLAVAYELARDCLDRNY